MRYELFGYQEQAAQGVLQALEKSATFYRTADTHTSFALTACTGAGKTVIASAVLEALFNGNDSWGVPADDSAAVLWLTDDESLNAQTRNRILASSSLREDQLFAISDEKGFPEELSRRHVYFLNVQKLHDASTQYTEASDTRTYSLWDTVSRTIENPSTTMYLVLDEAHKGMKNGDKSKATTVLRLINGEGSRPPVPIVWGISATPERFITAMKGAKGRATFPDIVVPTAAVQESGLLKDTIILTSPSESGNFNTTLLSSAVTALREQTERWESYRDESGLTSAVIPLMVVQVGDKPSDEDLATIVKTITDGWDVLTPNTIRNVFGEHTDIKVNGASIRYIETDAINEDRSVRVVLAKNAVTTGWDCPRAEVLFSMRGSKDRTVVTQLLGRMVRTPLAYRIPDNDLLNSVTCILPKFDNDVIDGVINDLTNHTYDPSEPPPADYGDGTEGGKPKVVHNPVTLTRNARLPHGVFDLIETIPTKPRPVAVRTSPIPNLFKAASLFTDVGAVKKAHASAVHALVGALDGIAMEFKDDLAKEVKDIETADVSVVTIGLVGGGRVDTKRAFAADTHAIESDFKDAARLMTAEIATQYQKHLVDRENMEVIDAKIQTAAIARLNDTVERLNEAAKTKTKEWVSAHRKAVELDGSPKHLAALSVIAASASTSVDGTMSVPENRVESSKDAMMRDRNVLSTGKGMFPSKENKLESLVLDTELGREKSQRTVAWYRNPGNPVDGALRIPYTMPDGRETTAQPDFVFVQQNGAGDYVASVVDPHGSYLRGGIDRLKGIATYMSEHGDSFHRFECVTTAPDGKTVRLDMTRADVRDAVMSADDEVKLFTSPFAEPYV